MEFVEFVLQYLGLPALIVNERGKLPILPVDKDQADGRSVEIVLLNASISLAQIFFSTVVKTR